MVYIDSIRQLEEATPSQAAIAIPQSNDYCDESDAVPSSLALQGRAGEKGECFACRCGMIFRI